MGKAVQSDGGSNFTMQVVRLVVIAVVSLGVLVGCQPVRTLTPPGDLVSSGEFYDFVVHFYTTVLPPLIEARDWDKAIASIPVDRERWKLKDEDGKIWDLTSRGNYWKKRWSESLARGDHWDVSYKIKKVTMTDATHGAIVRINITDWRSADRTQSGRSHIHLMSHWEKIDGQWLSVYTEVGRRY